MSTRSRGKQVSRRDFFHGAAACMAGGGALASSGRDAHAAMGKASDEISVRQDGTYATVPLAKESVSLAVMQTRVRPVDAAAPEKGRRENLEHMVELIDSSQTWGPAKDMLFFHEFPITGFRFEWTRQDVLRAAIELPGAETETLGKKAKQYGCYLVFGSYVRDPDWKDHVLSITTIIGPDGAILDRHWKARNIMGVFAMGREPIELMTSTIYNCFDRYVEMYGADAVIPVTRTPLGNICTSSVQREPELFRAMALKGCELMLRTATGGFTPADIQACAMYNGVYTAICNNSVSPGNFGIFEDASGGGSAIYDPRGNVMAQAASEHEQEVTAIIPIGQFRARKRQPDISMQLYKPVFDKYVPQWPASKFTQYLPTDLKDAARYLRDPKNKNWK
jgi:predicted amidohydrolase